MKMAANVSEGTFRRKATLLSTATVFALACTCAPAAWAQRTHHAATSHAAATAPAADSSTIKNVFWQPNDLSQGSPAFFTIEFGDDVVAAPKRVSGTWMGKPLSFSHGDDPKVWFALAGDDIETKPGSYNLTVSATLDSGKLAHATKKVEIAEGRFKTGTVDVPQNFVEPNAEEKKQIAQDVVLKEKAYAHVTPGPLWSGNFVTPVNGRPTGTFGESRILNEEKTSTHRGTDYPVAEGMNVVASNSGTVVLASYMFYEGGCIIIDHGGRLFTIYMHLSKMTAAVGDHVEKGAQIGLSGRTGRVTGPHLHMGVRWNTAYLDPTKLIALTLPKTLPPAADAAPAEEKKPSVHRAARRTKRR